MRYAIVIGDTVVNVILSDDEPENGIATDVAGPGWTYDGKGFVAPVVARGPVRITKADFQRLLTPTERYALNALRKKVAALPPTQYADPANGLLLAAEDVLFAFEQPAEFIELNHPDTFQGLMLLSYLGVITPQRVAEIVG
jgi:hypothetical protein